VRGASNSRRRETSTLPNRLAGGALCGYNRTTARIFPSRQSIPAG
jgi:hypothetical protein